MVTVDARQGATRMLVRVRDADEAACADRIGVDVVETDLAALPSVRAAFPRSLRLVVDGLTPETFRVARANQADEIAAEADGCATMSSDHRGGLAVIARAPTSSDVPSLVQRLRGRVQGIMLEPEPGHRFLDGSDVARLDAIAANCRAADLGLGFGGSLEAPDVARLLLLRPDVLGFDTGVRRDPAPGQLDPHALETVRALIPRAATPPAIAGMEALVDRIFVRDFVLSMSIGAYSSERKRRQRVRFDVEVDVARQTSLPRDMRDVFSYDIIIETIRMLAARPHVAFVESLADELASALLDHCAVRSVGISVAKLDVIEGAVGIEIQRRRAT